MNEPGLIGSLLVNADEFVGDYVAAKLGPTVRFRPPFRALGVVRRGMFLGGVIYHDYLKLEHGNQIMVSFAFERPDWALPQTVREICRYPFDVLKCGRVSALIAKSNKRSRKFVEGLGFKREGVHPRGMDGRETAISYGLLREQCRFLRKST